MTDYAKRLGYGGSATIYGIQVLITGGSFDDSGNPSFLEPLDLPEFSLGPIRRGRVYHAPGTASYTGSVSFDVTEVVMDNLMTVDKILQRNWEFDVGIHDGENSYQMTKCLAQTVTLSGSPGGLVNASVSFMGITGKNATPVTNDYVLNYDSDPTQQPAAYWWSGAEDVRDWTLSFTQNVTPMYGNVSPGIEPNYMLAGLVLYSLQVTTYSQIVHDTVDILTRAFTLTGVTTSTGYTFNGPNDLGMYSHTFETASDTGRSDGIIIV